KYSEIEKEAFMGTNITELTIDYKSGFKIGDDAFKNTSSLTKITLDASYEPSVPKWGLTATQITAIKYNETPVEPGESSNNTGLIVGLIIGFLAVAGLGVGGFFYWKKMQKDKGLAGTQE
ncbi:MAG: leucine-rich repeat protein, partial [Metamycoplasmataceae bacterium]